MTPNRPDPDPATRDPAPEPPDGPDPAGPDPGEAAAQPVDPRRPGARAGEQVEEGEEAALERYGDSPGAGLAGALDDLPEPNEPG